MKTFFERVFAFLDDLKTKDYDSVLVVAHSGVSKDFNAYFQGIRGGEFLEHGLKNCKIKMYELQEVVMCKGIIISAFATCGKTYLGKKYKNVIDLESSNYKFDNSDFANIPS